MITGNSLDSRNWRARVSGKAEIDLYVPGEEVNVSGPTYFRLTPRHYPDRLSLIIPLYNEVEVISLLRGRLGSFIGNLATQIELILINDGSTDSTLEKALEWAGEDNRVVLLNLARNFGHQVAVT